MRKAMGSGGQLGKEGELRGAEATSTVPTMGVKPALSWLNRKAGRGLLFLLQLSTFAMPHRCSVMLTMCFLSPHDADRF